MTIVLAAMIALAGCSEPKSNVPEVEKSDHEAVTNTPGEASNATPAIMAANVSEEAPAATDIAQSLRGRWGLVLADCDPARDDNKGLMTVEATTLKFYESRGTLATVRASDDRHIDADVTFNGEGQTWARVVQLTLEGPNRLVRIEKGEGAEEQPLTYMRCPA